MRMALVHQGDRDVCAILDRDVERSSGLIYFHTSNGLSVINYTSGTCLEHEWQAMFWVSNKNSAVHAVDLRFIAQYIVTRGKGKRHNSSKAKVHVHFLNNPTLLLCSWVSTFPFPLLCLWRGSSRQSKMCPRCKSKQMFLLEHTGFLFNLGE